MDENIKVHRGDVLITKDGTLGKVALISDEPPKPTTLNSGVFRIAAIDDSVDTRYLYHFFTSKYFVDFVESVKTGSTIPHLTQQGLLTLDIPLPNRDKQEKIIDTLDRVMQVYSEAYRRLEEEIEARRKQYEYYRNTLLSFKEVDR